MKAPARASIIINNYNYNIYLEEAIECALAQTYRETEVVVVDDGSTDESRGVIASYGDRVVPVFKANGGQASAFNAGFKASRGDVILFLDSDDSLLPTTVQTVLPIFDDPGVAKVHWPLRLMDARGELLGDTLPREPLPEGDFAATVIGQGPDSYLSMPTSGNAWSRRVLEQALPVPEREYKKGADGYLLTVTPLLGTIRRIVQPLGCYRVHGGNQFWCEELDRRVERSLARYECRSRTLAEFLSRKGIPSDPAGWKARNPYYQWMSRVERAAAELKAFIPEGAGFILADDGQWGSSMITGRRAVPFLEKDGQYWGPPANDAGAIEDLGRLRRSGLAYFVLGWPAFWWLDHYTGFVHHLRSTYECVLENDRLLAFDLRRAEGPPT
jgi:glycosyltransferase involved in cell wall biosynthesis